MRRAWTASPTPQIAVVGGKGAHLGELLRIEGIQVPAGFCMTTDAYRRIMAVALSIDDRLFQLPRLNPDDRKVIRTLSAQIRRTIEVIGTDGCVEILRVLTEWSHMTARSSPSGLR